MRTGANGSALERIRSSRGFARASSNSCCRIRNRSRRFRKPHRFPPFLRRAWHLRWTQAGASSAVNSAVASKGASASAVGRKTADETDTGGKVGGPIQQSRRSSPPKGGRPHYSPGRPWGASAGARLHSEGRYSGWVSLGVSSRSRLMPHLDSGDFRSWPLVSSGERVVRMTGIPEVSRTSGR